VTEPGHRFRAVFRQATRSATRPDGVAPFAWQERLAFADELPRLVDAPTGSGKTEAVIMAWLWRRRLSGDEALARATPRRLVLVLPMRVLVEQTHTRAERIVEQLGLAGAVRVHKLLGGAVTHDWTLYPADDQIIVATVDLAVSASLNRGYARGRASWPIDFGLLGEDTLTVYDEVQLLDAAVATSVQLDVFRREFRSAAPGPPPRTIWMSATLRTKWLKTVDHDEPSERPLGVGDEDREQGLKDRLTALKTVRRATAWEPDELAELALDVHEEHQPSPAEDWLTIVLCNTVKRAQAVHAELAKRAPCAELHLLHSRFRPGERAARIAHLDEPIGAGGRIVVTTQVIEAGVDLDAGALITDLCPWASLVQRAGRLNRMGRRKEDCTLVWLDPADVQAAAAPYAPGDLERAREQLLTMEGASASPEALSALASDELMGPPETGLVLRRPDLLDLFDTDPTLDGDDDDIRAYIRLGDQHDVYVAWRAEAPGPDSPAPAAEELCPVSLADDGAAPWRWSYADERWDPLTEGARLLPGDQLLLLSEHGMYSATRGWDPNERGTVEPVAIVSLHQPDGDTRDPLSSGTWQTIEEHTEEVVAALDADLPHLSLTDDERAALRLAARWHDAGKAHAVFQARVRHWTASGAGPWAKSGPPEREADPPDPALARRARGRFRHEAASVLMLHAAAPSAPRPVFDLALYLVGAHHGKLRVLPRTARAGEADAHIKGVLGVNRDDVIPAVTLGDGTLAPELAVDNDSLRLFSLGDARERVWIERVHDLLDRYGPFRLAYLEALLRVADQRASAEAVR
jgi:CRISPR-associated endonuclease/helicase Cas3